MSSSLRDSGDFCGLGGFDDFIKEPGPPFGFVDPVLDQTRRSDVVMLVAHCMRLAQVSAEFLIVGEQLPEHRLSRKRRIVAILQTLVTRDVANRPQGHAAKLSDPLRDVVSHGENLVAVVVQQEVIVAEMRSGHMPVKVLGFHIEREDIC